jgi:hypothetical protein
MERVFTEWYAVKPFVLGVVISSFATYKWCKMRVFKPTTYEIKGFLKRSQ